MFIIGLLDGIKKSLKKSVKSVYRPITKSFASISKPIGLKLLGNRKLLGGFNTDILGKISGGLDLTKINLDNISNMLGGTLDLSKITKALGKLKPLDSITSSIDFTNVIKALDKLKPLDSITSLVDFSGLVVPMKEIIEAAIKLISGIGKEQLTEIITGLLAPSSNTQALDELMPEVMDFNSFIKWANDIWGIMFGLKPFNIWIGKKGWVDKTKKGLYYNVTRFVMFAVIAYKVGFSAIGSFFNKMIEQKITEHYAYSKLSIQDYQALEFRGLLEKDELKEVGHFLGYNERAMRNIEKASKFFPSVRDLIDFAVREAFEPDENLFIHEGNAIPLPFSEFADKVGIDDTWIKKFWHSHWRLLGSGQLLEAFHRGFITKEFLLDYLRRLDYVEKDRELIMNMSYNLLTRVDIRRIFEQGLISSKELYDYYGTLGFTEKDKSLMTGLAKQLRFIDTNDLRRIYIERYENGLINESEIKSLLHSTGLDLDEINSYLYLSDSEKELEFILELKKLIERKFYEGDIDFDELIQQLRGLGVSNRELKRIEKHAVLFDFRKKKLPTLAELKRYYTKNIIDLNKFVYYALRLGLEREHIYWILEDITRK